MLVIVAAAYLAPGALYLFVFGGSSLLHEERSQRSDALVKIAGFTVVLHLKNGL
jgi:hypothetical protein